jgi:hypothetical protein
MLKGIAVGCKLTSNSGLFIAWFEELKITCQVSIQCEKEKGRSNISLQ